LDDLASLMAHRGWTLLLVGLVLGACKDAAPRQADREWYLYATLAKGLEAAERFTACHKISKKVVVGECMLAVAQTAAQVRHEALSTYCPQLPDGLWKDECYFLAAESVKRHDREEAGAMCNAAGQFVDDCGQHLWQSAVGGIAPRTSDGWEAALPKAERLYQKWAPILTESTDFASRFWQRFFQRTFEPQRVLDVTACDALEAPYDEHCAAAAAELYWRRVHMLVSFPDGAASFCEATQSNPSVEAVAKLPRLEAIPHPALEPVVGDFRARCAPE